MAKTCLKRRLFDDRNDVFWRVVGFKKSGGAFVAAKAKIAGAKQNWNGTPPNAYGEACGAAKAKIISRRAE